MLMAWQEIVDFLLARTQEIADTELDQIRFANSQTAGSITPQDRNITCTLTMPYTSDETSLYGQAVAGISGTLRDTSARPFAAAPTLVPAAPSSDFAWWSHDSDLRPPVRRVSDPLHRLAGGRPAGDQQYNCYLLFSSLLVPVTCVCRCHSLSRCEEVRPC